MSTPDTLAHAGAGLPLTHFLSASADIKPTSSPSVSIIAAVKATLTLLYSPPDAPGAAAGTPGPLILPGQLIVVSDNDKSARLEATGRAPALTLLANEAAASIACGSVLAGQTSESDEFGDAGFWLGPGSYGQGDELEILRALGLADRAGQLVKRVDLDSSTSLPAPLSRSSLTPELRRLVEALSNLVDTHGFRVRLHGPEKLGDAAILYVLLGRREVSWMGLMGIAVALISEQQATTFNGSARIRLLQVDLITMDLYDGAERGTLMVAI